MSRSRCHNSKQSFRIVLFSPQSGHRRQQPPRVRVLRRRKDLLGLPVLNQMPFFKDIDKVADGGDNREVVRDQQKGQPLFPAQHARCRRRHIPLRLNGDGAFCAVGRESRRQKARNTSRPRTRTRWALAYFISTSTLKNRCVVISTGIVQSSVRLALPRIL